MGNQPHNEVDCLFLCGTSILASKQSHLLFPPGFRAGSCPSIETPTPFFTRTQHAAWTGKLNLFTHLIQMLNPNISQAIKKTLFLTLEICLDNSTEVVFFSPSTCDSIVWKACERTGASFHSFSTMRDVKYLSLHLFTFGLFPKSVFLCCCLSFLSFFPLTPLCSFFSTRPSRLSILFSNFIFFFGAYIVGLERHIPRARF